MLLHSSNRNAVSKAISWDWQEQSMAKQTRITVVTDSLLVLRSLRPLLAWCPECFSETEMIPLEGLGVISNLSAKEVESWLDSELIHRSKAIDGTLLICLSSLLERVRTMTPPGDEA